MRVNMQLNTIPYKNNNPLNSIGKNNKKPLRSADVTDGHINLKRMLSESRKEAKNAFQMTSNNSAISNAMSYSEKLKAQRENTKNTNLEKKKLKYQFKDISSKIISSKTSQVARQAVSSARRELLRLRKEKASGEYDPEEIEAAITHAKAMERVAKKKVKHLEEEEMAKAAGGPCADVMLEQEEKEQDTVDDAEAAEEESTNDLEQEELQVDDFEMNLYEDDFEDMSFEDMLDELENLTSDMLDELGENMQDMLEELGLDELDDSLVASKGDMDPQDLKMMKIKHRCKEMKEMTKADSEYLKAVFDHLEKMKDGGMTIPTGNATGFAVDMIPAISMGNIGMESGQTSFIDVSV